MGRKTRRRLVDSEDEREEERIELENIEEVYDRDGYDEVQENIRWQIKCDGASRDYIDFYIKFGKEYQFLRFDNVIYQVEQAFRKNETPRVHSVYCKDDDVWRDLQYFVNSVIRIFNLDRHPSFEDNYIREDRSFPYKAMKYDDACYIVARAFLNELRKSI